MATPYNVLLRQLRQEKGLSQAELFRRTKDVGFDTIRALEQDPAVGNDEGKRSRARYPSPATLEAIAAALEVDPREFAEYRLALARRLFDERQVGLEEALANLGRLDEALRLASEKTMGSGAERASRRTPRSRGELREAPAKGQGQK